MLMLQPGDEIRVIAPSFSWRPYKVSQYIRGIRRIEQAGYVISLGKYLKTSSRFGTAPLQNRLADLHDAFAAKNVKAIICLNGGWSSNELLPEIDWDLLRSNPKPLIGFSDITVLLNAIYAKTGNVNLLGPDLAALGMLDTWEYSLNNLTSILTQSGPLELKRSQFWQRDKKDVRPTRPWNIVQPGKANGTLIGGNLGTYYLLQGTDFAPKLTGDMILAIEDDDEAGKLSAREFDRRFESLLQQKGAYESTRAVLIGRFMPSSNVSMADIKDIISRKLRKEVVVVADIDFGHTKPLLTLPIGGTLSVDATGRTPQLKLLKY